jgi:hypothetical protein
MGARKLVRGTWLVAADSSRPSTSPFGSAIIALAETFAGFSPCRDSWGNSWVQYVTIPQGLQTGWDYNTDAAMAGTIPGSLPDVWLAASMNETNLIATPLLSPQDRGTGITDTALTVVQALGASYSIPVAKERSVSVMPTTKNPSCRDDELWNKRVLASNPLSLFANGWNFSITLNSGAAPGITLPSQNQVGYPIISDSILNVSTLPFNNSEDTESFPNIDGRTNWIPGTYQALNLIPLVSVGSSPRVTSIMAGTQPYSVAVPLIDNRISVPSILFDDPTNDLFTIGFGLGSGGSSEPSSTSTSN